MAIDPATANLDKIEHIVVLMLENCSFDRMLGYLSLEGGRADVDGLRSGMSNEAGGRTYPIEHLASTHIPNPHWDPDHSSRATDRQIWHSALCRSDRVFDVFRSLRRGAAGCEWDSCGISLCRTLTCLHRERG